MTAEHIALLGDSIFDNAAYTRGEPDVVTHLRSLLPDGWHATLCAVDGATTASVRAQVSTIPRDASRLILAVGGNDALQNSDLLDRRSTAGGSALGVLAERLEPFERSYRAAVRVMIELDRPLVVCTIYNGALEHDAARLARVGLMMFNDVIVRTAIDHGLDIIELRAVCTEAADYANPIEPSGAGGLKIAGAIARAVGAVRPPRQPSRVWS